MSDINQLRKEEKWWGEELHARQRKVEEATREFTRFQKELMQAEQEENRHNSMKKVA